MQINNQDTMTMLYTAVQGTVQETHYGLALARIVPLPPGVLENAAYFAHKLERRLHKKKKTSLNVLNERRRRLILDLKEHLVQAYNGTLEGELLAKWLKELQKEFVNRMTALQAETQKAAEEDGSEGEGSAGEEDDMKDMGAEYGEEFEEQESMLESQPNMRTLGSGVSSTKSYSVRAASEECGERTKATARQPSVMTITSGISSTESYSARAVSEAPSTVRAVSENEF